MDISFAIISLIFALVLLGLLFFTYKSFRFGKFRKLNSILVISILSVIIIYLLSDYIFYLNEINIINEVVFKHLIVFVVLLILFVMLLINTITSFKIINLILLVIIIVISSLFVIVQPKLGAKEIELESACSQSEKVSLTLDNVYTLNGVGPWHKHFYSTTPFDQIKTKFKEEFGVTTESSNAITYTYTKDGQEYTIVLTKSSDKKVFILNRFAEGIKYSILIECTEN